MRYRRPVLYRLGHGGHLLSVVDVAVRIRAYWVIHTPVSVHVRTFTIAPQDWGIPRYQESNRQWRSWRNIKECNTLWQYVGSGRFQLLQFLLVYPIKYIN